MFEVGDEFKNYTVRKARKLFPLNFVLLWDLYFCFVLFYQYQVANTFCSFFFQKKGVINYYENLKYRADNESFLSIHLVGIFVDLVLLRKIKTKILHLIFFKINRTMSRNLELSFKRKHLKPSQSVVQLKLCF